MESKVKFKQSQQLLERAKQVTPLGSQTYSKSSRYYCEGYAPAFVERGQGAYVWDVDGNKFIDFVCALGPITVGYNDPRVNQAILHQLQQGIVFSIGSQIEVELAEKVTQIIPGAEMVRFVKNGSDATSAAIRLARAYTGKDLIAVCGYHGMQDWYIAATANNRGIPESIRQLTKTFPYNNAEALESLLENHPGEFAAIIMEPIQGDGPKGEYLHQVHTIAKKHGTLLIFDEVVSGFRYALGGASELYDIKPDLAAFGKGCANGMPLSFLVGRKEILALIEAGVFISTTFGGEAISMAAAKETIRILEQPNSYTYIWELGEMMRNGLLDLVESHQLQNIAIVSGLAPHCGLLFEGVGTMDYLDVMSIFQSTMIEQGILTVGINNINLAHTKDDIKLYLDAVNQAFLNIGAAIQANDATHYIKGKKVNPVFKRNSKT